MSSSMHNDWYQFAEDVGGTYEYEAPFARGFRVSVPCAPWRIVFTYYDRQVDPLYHKYLFIRVDYVSTGDFRFTLHPASLASSVGALVGLQDINVGDPEFDANFVVKGREVAKVQELFADTDLRDLLRAQPKVHLAAGDKEGLITRNLHAESEAVFGQHSDSVLASETVEELYFHSDENHLPEYARLQALHKMFTLLLRRMVLIGAATEANPYAPFPSPPD